MKPIEINRYNRLSGRMIEEYAGVISFGGGGRTDGGFGLGDFYFDCNLKEQKHGDSPQMDLLIFYCPIQYKNES